MGVLSRVKQPAPRAAARTAQRVQQVRGDPQTHLGNLEGLPDQRVPGWRMRYVSTLGSKRRSHWVEVRRP
jgi:hypothetical protein